MKRGLTLAEVMVAVGLLALAILGLVSAQLFATRASNEVSERHLAGVIAASLMADAEVTLRKSFSQSVSRARSPVPEHRGYQAEVNQNVVMSGDLKEIEVIVYWVDKKGPQEHHLWTKIARR